jgi:alkylation response protein AidB-like acyl-CoA dehydrogenase
LGGRAFRRVRTRTALGHRKLSTVGQAAHDLYNYTHAWIQPQAVVTKMRALAQHPAMIDRKVAMYTEGVLARQQAKRVAEGRDNMRVFGCRADALAFLAANDLPRNDPAATPDA